jgi:hypothetical protein
MPLPVHHLKSYLSCGLAGFLVIWLSGLALLICCPNIAAANPDEAFCPLAKMGGHCNKAKKDGFPSWKSENATDCGLGGCAYLPIVFDKSRKVEKAKKQAASVAVPVRVNFVPLRPRKTSSLQTISSYRIAFDNRILARHCILRI